MLTSRSHRSQRPNLAIMFGQLVALCTALLATPITSQAQDHTPFRVITYNVLVGFGDYRVGDPYLPGAERKATAYKWLANQAPDVVAFQEMNGYTTESLAVDAKTWGHPYAALLKETGYDLGITSKYEIEVIERLTEGMHHGLFHCRTGGIDFIVVHLWPFKDDARRLHEVKEILMRVEQIESEGRPCIVLGDFNAVSRLDDDLIAEASMEWFAKWNWNLDENARPLFDVIDAVMASNLVDLWAVNRDDDTPVFPARPRIDFIFASPNLARRCTASRWISTVEKHKVSDHPPMVVDLNWTIDQSANVPSEASP